MWAYDTNFTDCAAQVQVTKDEGPPRKEGNDARSTSSKKARVSARRSRPDEGRFCYDASMTLFEERPLTHKAAKQTFSDRVLKLALSIPSGKVSTYGAIARAAGGGGIAAQSITGILAKAWDRGEKNIPFHRIVYSDGRIWTSPEYHAKRLALYKKEGIRVDAKNRIVDFADRLHEF